MNEIQYEKPPGTESPSTDQRQKFVSNEFRDESAELNPFLAEPYRAYFSNLKGSGNKNAIGERYTMVLR